MKDLYTFDITPEQALETYHGVCSAYSRLFKELKLPFLVAEADSGDIGGNLSHEFHFPTSKGEDHVINCSTCDYVANEELAESMLRDDDSNTLSDHASPRGEEVHGGCSALPQVWRGVSKDRKTLVNVWFPESSKHRHSEVNFHVLQRLLPQLDTTVEDSSRFWDVLGPECQSDALTLQIINVIDGHLSASSIARIQAGDPSMPYHPHLSTLPEGVSMFNITQNVETGNKLNILRIQNGDDCPRCTRGKLHVQQAIELGHTFHLGTRYSDPMKAVISVPSSLVDSSSRSTLAAVQSSMTDKIVPFQMGCHGIGVSRIIGAVADTLVDKKGLNWPRVMAPFEVVIIPGKDLESAAVDVYDTMVAGAVDVQQSIEPLRDIALDDRKLPFPWKLKDADLVGYPVIVVVGRKWKTEKKCEVQCRRLNVQEEVPIEDLYMHVTLLLSSL